jgi:hypothetical protein
MRPVTFILGRFAPIFVITFLASLVYIFKTPVDRER